MTFCVIGRDKKQPGVIQLLTIGMTLWYQQNQWNRRQQALSIQLLVQYTYPTETCTLYEVISMLGLGTGSVGLNLC